MKKIQETILLITCVVCLLFMFGCNKKGNDDTKDVINTSSVEKEKVITGSSGIEERENAYSSNDVTYTIKTKAIVTTNINVNYPQIVGLQDKSVQMKWNDAIKGKVEADLNYIGSRDKYFLNYDVKTQNEEMISILMVGETTSVSSGGITHQFKYTFNIDLDTGNSIRLKDRVNTEKIATNLLNGKKYSLVEADDVEFKEYIDLFYDKKSLMDEFNEFDFAESFAYTRGYSYYEDGEIYLCMNVNKQLGDIIEILIDN